MKKIKRVVSIDDPLFIKALSDPRPLKNAIYAAMMTALKRWSEI